MTYQTTRLDRAVDEAIAAENARFLSDDAAMKAAAEQGILWGRAIEAQKRGFVQMPYPQETLEQFCQRAGV